MSEAHANWLNNVMDKAVFAIIAGKDDEDKELRADVNCLFATLVEEGRQYIDDSEKEQMSDIEEGLGEEDGADDGS